MKKQRWTIGSIIKIPLTLSHHAYGQLLDKNSVAIFNINTDIDLTLENILSADSLFIIAVYSNTITSGRWQKIFNADLREEFKILPLKFIQDSHNLDSYELYNPNNGEITKSDKRSCLGLECSAVWGAEHVESRIIDHFAGRQNIWVQQLGLK